MTSDLNDDSTPSPREVLDIEEQSGRDFSSMFGCSECEEMAYDILVWLAAHGNRWDTPLPDLQQVTKQGPRHSHAVTSDCDFTARFLEHGPREGAPWGEGRVNRLFIRMVQRRK